MTETGAHLLFKCHYVIRIWNIAKDWFGLPSVEPSSWHSFHDVKSWWTSLVQSHHARKNAMASHIILVSLEPGNERNTRFFKNTTIVPSIALLATKWKQLLGCSLGHKIVHILGKRGFCVGRAKPSGYNFVTILLIQWIKENSFLSFKKRGTLLHKLKGDSDLVGKCIIRYLANWNRFHFDLNT
jgi:hypothetical protein